MPLTRSFLTRLPVGLLCGLALVVVASPAALAQGDPYGEASLSLDVGQGLVVGHDVTVTAAGNAPSPLVLSIFVDPLGGPCPPSAAGRPAGAQVLVSGQPVERAFVLEADFRPTVRGDHTFCAYLGASDDAPVATATTSRVVKSPFLRAAVARHTVPRALKRHGFARRVVHAVNQRCHRLSKRAFRCRFSARFPGYKLAGRGKVRLTNGGVAYRLRVRAQGVQFVLTDGNEERSSG